jgi:hypothetical protein
MKQDVYGLMWAVLMWLLYCCEGGVGMTLTLMGMRIADSVLRCLRTAGCVCGSALELCAIQVVPVASSRRSAATCREDRHADGNGSTLDTMTSSYLYDSIEASLHLHFTHKYCHCQQSIAYACIDHHSTQTNQQSITYIPCIDHHNIFQS